MNDVARILSARRAELQATISRREPITIERHADALDNGNQFAAREVSAQELAKLTRKLAAVEAAIARLADGTYGDCVECGDPISAKRLAAVPEADRCVWCQQVFEEQEAAAIAGGAELEEAEVA